MDNITYLSVIVDVLALNTKKAFYSGMVCQKEHSI
jgi:hypothetical protein